MAVGPTWFCRYLVSRLYRKTAWKAKGGGREPGLVLSMGWGTVAENVRPAPRTYRESGDKRHHVELG